MKVWPSLLTVAILAIIAWLGAGVLRLYAVFGIGIPYLAFIIFAIGFVNRLLKSGRSSRPSMAATGDRGGPENSSARRWRRLFREILFFRFFFDGLNVTKWLWLVSFIFYGSLLVIALRHLRLFLNRVPAWIQGLTSLDSLTQIGFPHTFVYITDILILLALAYAFVRLFLAASVKEMSPAFDWLPLFLLLGSVLSGIVMYYFLKVDIVSVKEFTVGLVTLKPFILRSVGSIFYVHIFLVSSMFVYLVLE
ncbi:hypothetical protein CEB3_c14480 [Peptococcaceae bacterium CEB3]|nr:hypothetical protein CEB3_c14480 [Peptococcaceae bacterium CEB3]